MSLVIYSDVKVYHKVLNDEISINDIDHTEQLLPIIDLNIRLVHYKSLYRYSKLLHINWNI